MPQSMSRRMVRGRRYVAMSRPPLLRRWRDLTTGVVSGHPREPSADEHTRTRWRWEHYCCVAVPFAPPIGTSGACSTPRRHPVCSSMLAQKHWHTVWPMQLSETTIQGQRDENGNRITGSFGRTSRYRDKCAVGESNVIELRNIDSGCAA